MSVKRWPGCATRAGGGPNRSPGTDRHLLVDDHACVDRAGGDAVVVERVGRGVERLAPRAGHDQVPPGGAVLDHLAADATGDVDGLARAERRARASPNSHVSEAVAMSNWDSALYGLEQTLRMQHGDR